MNRETVSSSNIASIGYDQSTELLEVEFLNGSVYHYFNVPGHLHSQLMSASSHGTFLNAEIKGTYQYSKV